MKKHFLILYILFKFVDKYKPINLMNHNLLICLIFAFGFVTSCKDLDDSYQPDSIVSRATTPEEDSELNPTLLTDWENVNYIYLSATAANGQSGRVTPPWRNGSSSKLVANFGEDIKKADGWIMLFHTFCKSNLDVGVNYLCFYNQLTGYLKFLYHSDDADVGEQTLWTISCDSPNGQGFFADEDYFSSPYDDEKIYSVNSITAENMLAEIIGLSHGWNGFQMRVGAYQPQVLTAPLTIGAYNIAYTNYNFSGNEEFTTTGSIRTINSVSQNVFDNAIVKGVIDVGAEKAKDLVDKFAEKNLNKKFLWFNIKDVIAKIGTQDYAGAIVSGLDMLYKTIFKKGPSYSVSEVNLKTTGEIAMQGFGNYKNISRAKPIKIDFNQILCADRSQNVSDIQSINQVESSKIELGLWNIKKRPIVYYDRYTLYENYLGIPIEETTMIDLNGMVDYPGNVIGDVEIILNPAIKPYVKSYNVQCKLADITGGNRNLNNYGKVIIPTNGLNKLISQGDVDVYGITNDQKSLWGMIPDKRPNIPIDNDTKFYIDWGDNLGGYRAAIVTVTLNYNFNGQEMSVTESRVYDVTYKPSPNSKTLYEVNNPPYTYLLNQGNEYVGFNLK